MAHVRKLSTQNETEDPVVRGQPESLCRLLSTFFFEAGSLLHMELAD